MSAPRRIVVVGAGLAGLRAAEALRRGGFDGALTLAGGEPHLPYDRPPLSKDVLARGMPPEDATYRPAEHFAEQRIELRLGARATGLDVERRELTLADGGRLAFDALLVATGARARALPASAGLAGVHTLRTLDDARALRAELRPGARVVVAGAGFIGAEVASSARALGLDVTLVEAAAAPLVRAVGAEVGEAWVALHRDHGTDLRCGVTVEAAEGAGRVERIRLSDGSSLVCDVLVLGLGAAPDVDWLAGSGLRVEDGLVCDATLMAAPGIWAAGDCARWAGGPGGALVRREHWTNAVEQALHAARNMLAGAEATPFARVNYGWSDQYGVRVQFAGATTGAQLAVAAGALHERRFLVLYGDGGRLAGALAMGAPRELMSSKALIEAGTSWEDALAQAAERAGAAQCAR